jgi:hypothetical protein
MKEYQKFEEKKLRNKNQSFSGGNWAFTDTMFSLSVPKEKVNAYVEQILYILLYYSCEHN